MKMDAVIENNFKYGFTNHKILLQEESHGIKPSLHSLSPLSNNQPWQRRNKTDEVTVALLIHQQLRTSGQHGYCWMHR